MESAAFLDGVRATPAEKAWRGHARDGSVWSARQYGLTVRPAGGVEEAGSPALFVG